MKKDITEILTTLRATVEAQPDESFKANARIRLLNLVGHRQVGSVAPGSVRKPFSLLRWLVGAAVSLPLLSAGIVYGAQSSRPGSLFYPVKIASENVALDLAPTAEIKTAIAGAVIDRRAQEVYELKTDDPEEASRAASDYQKTVGRIRELRTINLTEVEEHIREHEDLLETESHEVPQRTQERERVSPTPVVSPTLENKEKSSENITPAVLGKQTEGSSDKNEDEYHKSD